MAAPEVEDTTATRKKELEKLELIIRALTRTVNVNTHAVNTLTRKVEQMSAGLEALTQKIEGLETADQAVKGGVEAAVTELVELEKEVETFKNNGNVSDAELEPLTARIENATAGLDTAVTALAAAAPQPGA